MASLNSPVELPTARMSRMFSQTPDLHDQPWAPVSTASSTPYFDAVPQFPNRSSSRPTTPKELPDSSQYRAKYIAPSELEAGPLPVTASLQGRRRPQLESRNMSQDSRKTGSDDIHTISSPAPTISAGAPSTVGSQTMLNDQIYTIPGSNLPAEDMAFPVVPLSQRSSMISLKRPAVPTSKYNRKPAASVMTSPSLHTTSLPSSPALRAMPQPPGQSQMPYDSPRLRPSPLNDDAPVLPAHFIPPPIPVEPAAATPKLSYMKSTASERKARALHSHPSNPSIRQEHSPDLAVTSSAQRTHRKSIDSRKSSIHDSSPPSAPPQEPLPELPPQARRPPTREKPYPPQPLPPSQIQPPPEAHIPMGSPRPATQTFQHKELADFMTAKSTIIFRRFDDVHVRLLLSLQDEITSLERQLAELERSNQIDRDSQRVKVMGELRRVLAEYDHLFTNWKLMQASKADETTKDELEQWLQRSGSTNGTISKGAAEDLQWLQNSRDLSSVQIGSKPKPPPSIIKEKSTHEVRKDSTNGGGGGGGGFSLFSSCVGKRK